MLYYGWTVTSSHWRCVIKKLHLKSSLYPQEKPVLQSLFKKVAGLKAHKFIAKRPQHMRFPVNIVKFLRLTLLKNIFKWLLFDCFNGSLLHGLVQSIDCMRTFGFMVLVAGPVFLFKLVSHGSDPPPSPLHFKGGEGVNFDFLPMNGGRVENLRN